MTQKEMVLNVLRTDGCITTYDAFVDLGCTRLPSRINELRNEGIEIEHIVCTKENRFGKSVSFFIYYIQSFKAGKYGLSGFQVAWARKLQLEAGR